LAETSNIERRLAFSALLSSFPQENENKVGGSKFSKTGGVPLKRRNNMSPPNPKLTPRTDGRLAAYAALAGATLAVPSFAKATIGFPVTIVSYAFGDAGEPIMTGQVPEPSTMALLGRDGRGRDWRPCLAQTHELVSHGPFRFSQSPRAMSLAGIRHRRFVAAALVALAILPDLQTLRHDFINLRRQSLHHGEPTCTARPDPARNRLGVQGSLG